MNPVTKDLKLANGEIVQVGMNFHALSLMTRYPGGFGRLQNLMSKPDNAAQAMDAFEHVFWSLIRAGGKVCTKEECAMSVGFDDFHLLTDIIKEFGQAAQKLMPKNAAGRAHQK